MVVPQGNRGELGLWDYQLDLAVVSSPLLLKALPKHHDAIRHSYATPTTITAIADYFFSITRVESRFLWAYRPLVRLPLVSLVELNTSQPLQTYQAARYTRVVGPR